MTTVKLEEVEQRLSELIDQTSTSHEPIHILGKNHSGVLVSESDWQAIQETLYLLSVPGLRETVQDGMAASVSELSTDPGW